MIQQNKSEKGQALILIVFAIIGLLALLGLAMDGGQSFSDRRQAQNAADGAALAAALAYQKGESSTNIELKAQAVALTNGYTDGTPRCDVAIDGNGVPVTGLCPGGKDGKEFQVTIDSNLDTWFGPVVGITQVHNQVTATARGCEYHYEPFFDGNTIVGLAPTTASDPSFYAGGNTDVKLECGNPPTKAGGILVNGNASHSGSSLSISAPSMTVVGTGAGGFTSTDITTVKTVPTAAYVYPADILDKMPRTPTCNGTATYSSADGKWHPQIVSGVEKDGSKVYDWNGDQTYAAGTYCVMSVDHPWKNTVVATEGSTFFIMVPGLDMKLAGAGDGLQIHAPATGEYAGYAIVLPLTCTGGVICDMAKLKANPPTQTVAPCTGNGTPTMDLRGNGTVGITGSIWMPSACLTLYGNSGTTNHGQIVAYKVETSGSSDLSVCFKSPENPKEYYPPTVELVK